MFSHKYCTSCFSRWMSDLKSAGCQTWNLSTSLATFASFKSCSQLCDWFHADTCMHGIGRFFQPGSMACMYRHLLLLPRHEVFSFFTETRCSQLTIIIICQSSLCTDNCCTGSACTGSVMCLLRALFEECWVIPVYRLHFPSDRYRSQARGDAVLFVYFIASPGVHRSQWSKTFHLWFKEAWKIIRYLQIFIFPEVQSENCGFFSACRFIVRLHRMSCAVDFISLGLSSLFCPDLLNEHCICRQS